MLYVDMTAAPETTGSKVFGKLVEIIKKSRQTARVYTHTVVIGGAAYVLSTTIKDISLYLAGIDEEGRVATVQFILEQVKQHSCSDMMLGYDPKHVPGSSKKDGPQGLYIAAIGAENKKFQLADAH